MSQPLTLAEARVFQRDLDLQAKVLTSYELMLDFYGFDLVDATLGTVHPSSNFRSRFANLNGRGHNFLRITRILKCLGEVGLEHLKAPWVECLITETFRHNYLPRIRESLANYWIPVLRNTADRERLRALFESLSRNGEESSVQDPDALVADRWRELKSTLDQTYDKENHSRSSGSVAAAWDDDSAPPTIEHSSATDSKVTVTVGIEGISRDLVSDSSDTEPASPPTNPIECYDMAESNPPMDINDKSNTTECTDSNSKNPGVNPSMEDPGDVRQSEPEPLIGVSRDST